MGYKYIHFLDTGKQREDAYIRLKVSVLYKKRKLILFNFLIIYVFSL
jgi:hypothetical protein